MNSNEEILLRTILSKEVMEKNSQAFQILDFYHKTLDLVERTKFVRGKTKSFKISSSSTNNEKLRTNVFASTH